jgi:diguanylate cyclase (GGDEF)-like protein
MPGSSPSLDTLISSIATLTGHAIAFHPSTAHPPPRAHQWDVVGPHGHRHGLLVVQAGELDEAHRALYERLAGAIGSDHDLREENASLSKRVRLLSKHNTELTSMNRSLSEAAYRDSLTGVYRKWHLVEQLRVELARSRRYRRPLSLLVLDIDDFAARNTEFGLRGGDTLLRGFAERLRTTCRTADLLARLGGDEFGLLLPDTTATGASELLLRFRHRLAEEPLHCGATVVPLTFHAGVAAASGDGFDTSAETLLDRASQALNGARRAS